MADKKRPPIIYPGRTVSSAEKFNESPESNTGLFVEPPRGGWDSHYVPGYSDARHQNAVLQSEGKTGYDLDLELYWAKKDARGLQQARSEGWTPISDAEQDGNEKRSAMLEAANYEFPPMGEVVNGNIIKDDQILCWQPGEDYRARKRKQQQERAFLQGRDEEGGGYLETEERRKLRLSEADVQLND